MTLLLLNDVNARMHAFAVPQLTNTPQKQIFFHWGVLPSETSNSVTEVTACGV